MQDLNWNDLRFVLAVAREQSLAAAARRLGVNESTVGRRIAAAEDRLGARLFERTGGTLWPSAAGEAVLAAAERVEREVQAVHEEVSGSDAAAAGTVRLTAVPILVNRVLVPALPRLFEDHPALCVELIAEPRDLSLTRREADIALRLARPRREMAVVAKRIGRLDYAVYGPADPVSAGNGSDELVSPPLPWITYEDRMAGLPQWRWMAEHPAPGATPPLLVNDAEAILEAVKAGLGRSLLPVAVAGREPALAAAGEGSVVLSRELWMLVHPELRNMARVRAVIDWLEMVIGGLEQAVP